MHDIEIGATYWVIFTLAGLNDFTRYHISFFLHRGRMMRLALRLNQILSTRM